ncbi:MAG: Fe-S cluster assembly protein IscX [Armatimonadaceae bacterium]
MPKLQWDDSEDIAIELSEKHPDLDPLTVRFTDLHQMVMSLPDFADEAERSNESKLEAIQMAWLDEYKEMQGK